MWLIFTGGELKPRAVSAGTPPVFCAVKVRMGRNVVQLTCAYFLGANDPCKALRTTLKVEVDPDAWAALHSDLSRPFDKPASGRIAVKVINHLGDEVMKVFQV